MNNVDWKLTGDKLVITVDVSKKAIDAAPMSKTGRTYLVASTGAAAPIPAHHCSSLTFALNVMAKK